MPSNVDFEIFDCDNHYYEAVDAFTRYAEPGMAKRTMQWGEIDGKQRLLVGGKVNRFIPNPTFDPISKPGALDEYFRGRNPKGEGVRELFGDLDPMSTHPEYRNRDARLQLMDEQGMSGAIFLPTLGVGMEQALLDDPPALLAAFRAFNRWLEEDWGFAYQERIFGAPMLSFVDPDELLKSVQWGLDHDARFFVLVPGPVITRSGPVSPADPVFDPVWGLLAEAGAVVTADGGNAYYTRYLADWGEGTEMEAFRQNPFRSIVSWSAVQDWFANLLAHGLFQRFPNLRMASIETGSDWVFHLFDKLTKSYSQTPGGYPEDPRETFKRHVWVSPYYEDELAQLRDLIGADHMLMGSDYPHAEGLAEPSAYIKDLENFGFTPEDSKLVMRDNGVELSPASPRVTTLVWPPEAVPESVLTTLTGPGGPFELREEAVLGAPMLVFANRPKSLVELLHGAAERLGDRPYVVFADRAHTFASILQPIAAVAAALRDRYGVGPGDRVAVVAPNTVEYALVFWATTALGAITVGLNGWWTGDEIAYAVELTEPKVLFGDRRRLDRLEGVALPDGLPVVEFERDFAELEQHAPDAEFPVVDIDEDDPFVILFTSGTTGRPKGVTLSHRSNIHFLLASMLNGAVAMMTDMENGVPVPPPAERPVIISAAPMFHIAGLNCQLVASTLTNMTIVYPPPGKWREETHLELSQRHGATTWALVPTQLWRIVDSPDLDRYDTSSVRNVGGGSAVWPPELLRALAERIPTARAGTALGYGSTETTGLGTTLRPGPELAHADSIGLPSATFRVQVRDPETDKALPEGEVGEICVRGASCFLGYWRNPEATAKAVDDDRWYRTGDFGVIRDGYVHLEGRRQDLIIRGGENISPIEIENRLFEHPDVAEVAVIGVDHPKLGQEVVAVVVPHAPGALTEDAVKEWVAAALAGFKVPSRVEFRDSLPHNASGKVLKHVLASPEASSGFVEE